MREPARRHEDDRHGDGHSLVALARLLVADARHDMRHAAQHDPFPDSRMVCRRDALAPRRNERTAHRLDDDEVAPDHDDALRTRLIAPASLARTDATFRWTIR